MKVWKGWKGASLSPWLPLRRAVGPHLSFDMFLYYLIFQNYSYV